MASQTASSGGGRTAVVKIIPVRFDDPLIRPRRFKSPQFHMPISPDWFQTGSYKRCAGLVPDWFRTEQRSERTSNIDVRQTFVFRTGCGLFHTVPDWVYTMQLKKMFAKNMFRTTVPDWHQPGNCINRLKTKSPDWFRTGWCTSMH